MAPKNSLQQPPTSLQVYLGWARLQISFTTPNHEEFCMLMFRDHKICWSVHGSGLKYMPVVFLCTASYLCNLIRRYLKTDCKKYNKIIDMTKWIKKIHVCLTGIWYHIPSALRKISLEQRSEHFVISNLMWDYEFVLSSNLSIINVKQQFACIMKKQGFICWNVNLLIISSSQ